MARRKYTEELCQIRGGSDLIRDFRKGKAMFTLGQCFRALKILTAYEFLGSKSLKAEADFQKSR